MEDQSSENLLAPLWQPKTFFFEKNIFCSDVSIPEINWKVSSKTLDI